MLRKISGYLLWSLWELFHSSIRVRTHPSSSVLHTVSPDGSWLYSCVCVYIYIYVCVCIYIYIYRVIHKSLRDFRPLRYRSRDGHAEGEHVNRGRDTPSFCPTLQVLDMLTSEGSWQTFLAHARQSRLMVPAGLFVSQRTGSHSAGISCTTHELFCP